MKMCYKLCRSMLELAKTWNLGQLAVSNSICTVRFSKKALNLVNWEIDNLIWDISFFFLENSVIWDRESIK
jgi:hypothetical protein